MVVALLTAAGTGTRMGQDIPKQFIHVDNKPLIIHTIEAFQKHPNVDAIMVVTLPAWTAVLQAYAAQFNITKLKWIVSGGATGQFARDVLVNRDIVMKSAGTQLRSYCYGMDCATAILTVLLKGKPMEAYNISNRDSVVSIRQMAEAFAAASGRNVIFENATDSEQKSFNLMDNFGLNAEKLEALGWKARYFMEDGVRRTIEIMKG